MILHLIKSDSLWEERLWTWGHYSLKKEPSRPPEYMWWWWRWMCAFMFMRDLLLPLGEPMHFVLPAVLFACCVTIQIKHIIMAESTYDKYVEHRGSFIILTARIIFWPAGTGQKYSKWLEWTWNVSAVIMGFTFSSLSSPTTMFLKNWLPLM